MHGIGPDVSGRTERHPIWLQHAAWHKCLLHPDVLYTFILCHRQQQWQILNSLSCRSLLNALAMQGEASLHKPWSDQQRRHRRVFIGYDQYPADQVGYAEERVPTNNAWPLTDIFDGPIHHYRVEVIRLVIRISVHIFMRRHSLGNVLR